MKKRQMYVCGHLWPGRAGTMVHTVSGRPEATGGGPILLGQRARFTHLVFSVNGIHELYIRLAAKMEVKKTP